jgi:hypothetical protein
MTGPDVVNGAFEVGGSLLTWMNVRQVYKDKGYAGVYPPAIILFFAWGLWNLWFYPHLGQWISFYGGASLVAANACWGALMIRYGRRMAEAEAVVSGLAEAPLRIRTSILEWARVLIRPDCWIQNHQYSERWDRELRRLLAAGERFKLRDDYTATIGNYDVWIGNHPYASMDPRKLSDSLHVRPSRATILTAGKALRPNKANRKNEALSGIGVPE